MCLLQIVQKKGMKDFIHGKLTVYAIVDIDPSELLSANHPISSMVHNGLLIAQGNYREQSSIKDFLKSEMGESFEEGLEDFLDKLNGLEGALDPQKLKEKMKSLDDFKDFIPTPAKIVPFHSESEILQQEGDIFFVGKFKNMANANLSVNSFPILYQARYREQEIELVKNEIDMLISQIESNGTSAEYYLSPEIDIVERIIKDYIPGMLYSKKDRAGFSQSINKFKNFLRGYKSTDDIESIIKIISETEKLTPDHFKLLELYAKKIKGVSNEDFTLVNNINKEIEEIKDKLE